MEKRQDYTLGFIFNDKLDTVLLIEKKKPEWQKGYLNGIGGHVEDDESPKQCIIRECFEETNLEISKWKYVGDFVGKKWVVKIYTTVVSDEFIEKNIINDKTDEFVTAYPYKNVKDFFTTLSSVKYALPLCMESLLDNTIKRFKIFYK